MTSVLVVTPWFPNRPGEWEGNFVYNSVSALVRNGVSVGVLVTRPFVPRILQSLRPAWEWKRELFEPTAFAEFAQLHRVSYPSVPRNWLWRVSRWCHDRRVGPRIDSMVRSLRPNIIHAHTEGEAAAAVQAAERHGISAVVTLHGINLGARYFSRSARRADFRRSLRAADRVILVGEPLRPFFLEITGSDDNFSTIPNGVTMVGETPKRLFSNDKTPLRFVSVSNLLEGKGIDIALNALAEVSARGFENWDYTIVGDGAQRQAWTTLSHELGLANKVSFLGTRPHIEVFDILGRADVFLLPSYREAFGIAYLEAMATGLLAVGVAGEGPSAFITDNKTGLLVPPRDSSTLADCIISIVKNQGAMQVIAAAGAEYVRRNFSWDNHAKKLIDLYGHVTRKRGHVESAY